MPCTVGAVRNNMLYKLQQGVNGNISIQWAALNSYEKGFRHMTIQNKKRLYRKRARFESTRKGGWDTASYSLVIDRIVSQVVAVLQQEYSESWDGYIGADDAAQPLYDIHS